MRSISTISPLPPPAVSSRRLYSNAVCIQTPFVFKRLILAVYDPAGGLVSLLTSYLPGFSPWVDGLDANLKRLLMLLPIALAAMAAAAWLVRDEAATR